MIYKKLFSILLVMLVAVSCDESTEVTPTPKPPNQKVKFTSLAQEPQLERVLDAAGFLALGTSTGRTSNS